MFRNYSKLAVIPLSLYAYKNIKDIHFNKCYFCAYICSVEKRICLRCFKDIITKK